MSDAQALAAQQQAFAALLRGAASPAGAQRLLRPLRGEPPALAIYQQAWQTRLTEALRSNFPILHQVLGDDAFAALAAAFTRARPPHTPSIRWFGAALGDWLLAQPDALPHPALRDLARMEWALGLSFDSADAPPLTAESLAPMAPDQWLLLRVGAHPSLQWLALDWAVEPLWQQLTHAAGSESSAPEASAHVLLVWRQGLESRWRTLAEPEASLLRAALAGARFARLGALAAQLTDDTQAPGLLAAALQGWLAQGLLVAAPCSPDPGQD